MRANYPKYEKYPWINARYSNCKLCRYRNDLMEVRG